MLNSNVFGVVVVCSLHLFIGVDCQDPTVYIRKTEPETRDKKIYATQNNDVTMDCQVENLEPGTNVRWRKEFWNVNTNKTDRIAVAAGVSVEDNTLHSVEKLIGETWRLRIKSIPISGEGTYICFVTTTKSSTKEDKRQVYVRVKPVFIMGKVSDQTTVIEGEELELLCEADGRPKPTIMWRRVGSTKSWQNRYSTRFVIKKVTREDAGTYKCLAFNDVATIQKDIGVIVNYKPRITASTPVFQKPDYQIELQCEVEAHPRPVIDQISWRSDNNDIKSSKRVQVKTVFMSNGVMTELIIKPVIKDDFKHTYTCAVFNQFGSSEKMIQLLESDKAQKSVKLGKVIAGARSITPQTVLIVTTAMLTAFFSFIVNRIV